MQTTQPNLFTRPDTLFGVCQGLGENLGVSPTILRLAFAFSLLWSPVAVIGAYLGLGIVVATSRWMFPTKAAKQTVAAPRVTPSPVAENDAAEFAEAA